MGLNQILAQVFQHRFQGQKFVRVIIHQQNINFALGGHSRPLRKLSHLFWTLKLDLRQFPLTSPIFTFSDGPGPSIFLTFAGNFDYFCRWMSLPPNDSASILIVDDRPDKLMALEVVLAELTVNIRKAGSGREALEVLARHPDVAVILLDVFMPEMDGFQTAVRIREQPLLHAIPIIFVSALDPDDAKLQRGYSL